MAHSAGGPPRLLVVGHEASRTGSPIVLRSVVHWLAANTDWAIDIAFRKGGPLLPDFSAVSGNVTDLDFVRHYSKLGAGEALSFALQVDGLAPRFRESRLDRHRADPKPYDIVYANSASSLQAIRTGRSVPTVLHVHELFDALHQSLPDRDWGRLRTIPTHYIAASHAVADCLVDRIGIAREDVTVVYEFIEPLDMAGVTPPTGGPTADRPVILGCGSTGWRKGTDMFLQAAIAFYERNPDDPSVWIWVGGGHPFDDQQFAGDIERAGIGDRVQLLPAVDDPRPWFDRASVFVLPSREDPFPLVALEAASAGKPVVCFEGGGGMVELVSRGTGVVVPFASINAMADAVAALVHDPAEARRLGARGAAEVTAHHTPEQGAQAVFDVLSAQLHRAADQAGRVLG